MIPSSDQAEIETSSRQKPWFRAMASRGFPDWLRQQGVSLAFTTYQRNKLFFVGRKPDGQLSVVERTFPRCMGLWTDTQTVWLASQSQIWRMENMLADGELADGFDRLYVPRHGYVTGDLDVHDIAVDGDGRPVFVNTLFSCLATIDERHNFQPLWRPPFISRLAAEDRCHLNGLAMMDGRPGFVTASGQSDVADGWRDHRQSGGCVIDVSGDRVIAQGLCMPHSPRWHGGRLWLLEGGSGRLGWLDRESGRFEPVCFCPGFARGLAFVGNYAVVGLSQGRHDATFCGLPLEAELSRRQAQARCGLLVVDLSSGDAVHWLRIEGSVEELYEVCVLPGVTRPKALGFHTDEIRHSVWFHDGCQRQRWSGVAKTESGILL